MSEVAEFTYEMMIDESHLDTFGHVNNATYLILYEKARWDFITKRGYGLKEIHKLQKGPVILDIHITYSKELINRNKIKIISKFLGMKNRKVAQIEQKIYNQDGDLASTFVMTYGLLDFKKRKLIEPSERWQFAIGATNIDPC